MENSRIEAERALRLKRLEDGRERNGQYGSPEKARRNGPAHADFSVGQREDLCGVSEGHRSFFVSVNATHVYIGFLPSPGE